MSIAASVENGENAILYVETTQTQSAPTIMTDTGDHTLYTSPVNCWSRRAGYAPTVRPDGIITGATITTRSSNDTVNISQGQVYLAGLLTTVTAANVVCARTGDAGNPCIITSIIVTALGAYAALQGLKGASLSATRGAAGGPPLITVGCIEIGQIKYTSEAAAPIASTAIYQEVGVHRERFDYPGWEINAIPSHEGIIPGGSVTMMAAQALTHIGPTTKRMYVTYAEPGFQGLFPVSDFVPPTNSHTVNTVRVYGGSVATWAATVGQGSFIVYLVNGAGNWIFTLIDKILTFHFKPDRYQPGGTVCQGRLGVRPSFPATGLMVANCVITAAEPAIFGANYTFVP